MKTLTRGVRAMFEIFLFINPIGLYCYNIENQIQETINQLGLEVSYHFVPIANVNIVQDDILRRQTSKQQVGNFTYYSLASNQALKDYHAIRIAYGNKKARSFLFEMQEKLNHNKQQIFSRSLRCQVMTDLQLDERKIKQLSQSDYLKESIKQDQELAHQWHIQKTPTTIIFNKDCPANCGILLDGLFEKSDLIQLLTSNTSNKVPAPANNQCSFKNVISNNHLRLI